MDRYVLNENDRARKAARASDWGRVSARAVWRAERTNSIECRATKAFLFPGQGAQSVGMAKELCETSKEAKEMFDRARAILGYDLLDLCVNGPAEKLNSTVVSQPAIYVSSMAALEKMKSTSEGRAKIDAVDVCAGLSLGEYTALAFAGAFSFEDGLKLVKLRGEAMQAAADAQPSSMAAIIGLSAEKCEELCKAASEQSGKDVRVANYLCNGNYAVSGAVEAIEKVEQIAKPEFKAKMAVRLAVAGAFHTDFMKPAVEKLEKQLAATTINATRIPVISNVDMLPHTDPDSIRKTLATQVTNPVRWEGSMQKLIAEGLTECTEVGPGKVISGIIKRIDKALPCENYIV